MFNKTPQIRVLLGRCRKQVGLLLFGVFAIVSVVSMVSPQKASAVPSTINFQARLMTAAGAIVPDGNYNVEFKLYNTATVTGTPDQGACTRNGGTTESACLWTETRTGANVVQVKNGYLTANLGSVTSFGSVDFSQSLWLTMRIGGTGTPSWDGEMSPRLQLTALPYAFKAGDSATVGGLSTSGLVQLAPNSVQTDASTNSSIFINKTGASGNILTLQDAASTVLSLSNSGTLQLQPTTDSTTAFNIKNSSGGNLFTVDSSNTRVGIGLGSNNTPTLTHEGLEIKGSLRLSAGTSNQDTFVTPLGSSISTVINVPIFDPGNFNQVLALGVTATASSSSRVILVADGRTAAHQASIGVLSPNEGQIFGLSYDGSNTLGVLKNSSTGIALQGNSVSLLTATNSAGNAKVGIGNANVTYALDVTGDTNTSGVFRVGGTSGATTTCSGGQFLQNQVVVGGITTGGTCASGGTSGATSVGPISNTSTANGGSISAGVLTLNVADGTNGGVLSAAANPQTIGGTKTFTGQINASRNGTGTGDYSFGVTGATINDATSSLIRIGNAIASGNAAANGGTYIGLNKPSSGAGSAADYLNFQSNGTSQFQVANGGNVTAAGTYNSNTFTGSALTFGSASTATIQSAASQALNITANAASTWSTSAGNLTLDAAGGTIVIGSNTATLQKVGTALTFDLNSASNSTMTLTNAGAGVASLSVEGGVTIGSGQIFTVGATAGASTTCSGGQFLQNQVVLGGITTGGTCASGGTSGATSVGPISNTSTANGGSISAGVLTLNVADGTNGGVLSAAANPQTIGGAKTFSGAATFSSTINTNTFSSSALTFGAAATAAISSAASQALNITGNAASTFSTTAGALTLSGTAGLSLGSDTTIASGKAFTQTDGLFSQTSSATSGTAHTINSTNTTGTQANGIQYIRNGSGGTTTNGVNITNTAGTLTNGLSLNGTIGTGINFAGTFTNLISGTNFSVTNGGAITAAGTYNTNTFTGSSLTFGSAGTATIQSAASQTLNITGNAASTFSTSAGALTLTSAAAATWSTTAGNLTLDAGGGTIVLGANTTTLQKSGTAFTLDLNNSSNSTFTLTNAGTGVASLSVEGGVAIGSGQAFTVGASTGASTTCSGGQFLQNQVVSGGITTGGTCAAATSGVTTVGAISATSNANGATITGTTLNLTAADGTNGGVVTNTTQTFAGNKTFSGTIVGNSTIQGTQFTSTVATGTAPLVVSSTTKVTNLNADLLDGLDSTAFAAASGSANYIQNTTSAQTNANIAIQSAADGSATAVLKARATQTAALLSLQDSTGSTVAGFDIFGNLSGGQLTANAGVVSNSYSTSVNPLTVIQNAASANIPVAILRGGATPGAAGDLLQVQNSSSQSLAGFNNAGQLYLGRSSGAVGSFKVFNATNANTVTVQSGTTGTSYALTLPTALGSSGDCLKDTTGAGVLGFGSCSAAGAVTSVGAISATSNANGATITSGVLNLTAADGTNGGVVTNTTQTFAGAKTFAAAATFSSTINTNTFSSSALTFGAAGTATIQSAASQALNITGNAASTFSTSAGALTLTSAAAATWSTTAGNLTLQAGSGTVSLGSSTALTNTGALTITAGSTLSLASTTTSAITLDSGTTGNVNVGTGANAKTIAIGNQTGATSVTVDTGTGNLNLGTGGQARTINIGTSNAAAQTIYIGGTSTSSSSSNAGTAVNLQAGATTLDLTTSGAIIQTYINSTTAFQVANANGTPLFNVDTTAPSNNIVTNPGFEQGTVGSLPTSWTNKTSGALTRVISPSTAIYYGTSSGKLITAASANSGALYSTSLTLGSTYNLSFYARSNSGNTTGISFGYTNTGGDVDCSTGNVVYATGFTRYTCSFTVTTTAGTSIYIKQSGAASQTFFIDGVQLLLSATTPTAYNLGTIQLRGVINSPVVFQNANDSTTGFQIQNSVGTTLFNVDTLNEAIVTGNNGANTPWQTTTAVTAARYNAPAVYANGYAYVVQGGSASFTSNTTVYYAKVFANGTLGSWSTATSAIGTGVAAQGTVAYNGYLYSIGGIITAGTVQTASNYVKLDPDGNITQTWQSTTVLPAARWGGTAVAANGYMYYIGGQLTSSGAPLTSVYYAKINGDGSLGSWTTSANTLPGGRAYTSVVVNNNSIYVLGGDSAANGATPNNTVYVSTLNPATGLNAAFTTLTTGGFPSIAGGVAGAMNGYMYYAGGDNGSTATANTIYAKINSDGTLGTWTTSINSLPAAVTNTEGFVANGYLYVLGGATSPADTTPVSTSYVTSGPRVSIGSNLDLLSVQGAGAVTGAGSGGGSIYAGSIYSQGNLDVTGTGSIQGGLNVGGVSVFNGNASFNGYSICVKSTIAKCAGTTAGTIYATTTSITAADFAENYISSQDLQPGSVVKLAKDGNNSAVVETTDAGEYDMLGVVSTAPGVTINSDAATDAIHTHVVPVALSGRVPVKVTNSNGVIHAGDPLTASSVAGVAMKATHAGYVLGRALEDAEVTSDPNAVTSVMGFVNLSYFDGTLSGGDVQAPTSGSFTTINASGLASLTNMSVSGNAIFAGNVTVKNLTTTGTVTLASAIVTGDLTLGGHIVTQGDAPTFELQPYAGIQAPQNSVSTDPNAPAQHIASATVVGNDTSGKLTITIGDNDDNVQPGDLIKVTFKKAFGAEPQAIISARGKDSAQAQFYVNDVTKQYFTIASSGTLEAGKTYTLNYFTVQ